MNRMHSTYRQSLSEFFNALQNNIKLPVKAIWKGRDLTRAAKHDQIEVPLFSFDAGSEETSFRAHHCQRELRCGGNISLYCQVQIASPAAALCCGARLDSYWSVCYRIIFTVRNHPAE